MIEEASRFFATHDLTMNAELIGGLVGGIAGSLMLSLVLMRLLSRHSNHPALAPVRVSGHVRHIAATVRSNINRR